MQIKPQIVNKLTKLIAIILAFGVIGVIVLSIFICMFLENYSHSMALMNPEVAYMRIPVLIMTELGVGLFIVACILSIVLIYFFLTNRIFCKASVFIFRIISVCFLLMMFSGISLMYYTMLNVQGSITNFYVLIGICCSFIGAGVFLLFSVLIEQGYKYKSENDLTI